MDDIPDVPIIDRLGRGYFGVPDPPPKASFPATPRTNPWLAWKVALRQAKDGSFEYLVRLLDLYDPAGEYRFNYQCVILIGDAGPGRCFKTIRKELETPRDPGDYEVGIDFSTALSIRGRLADMPLLAAVYQRHATVEDADIIPVMISRVLEPAPGPLSEPSSAFPSAEAYVSAVAARSAELAEGNDQLLFLLGEQFGVVRLAERILDALQKPYFPPDLRRKFEASTGIDCTAFYEDEVIQPLAAAAIVEEFLESPEAAKYEDGVRYFFGHRIPD